MNYLAHLYLSGESENSILGNLIADFVKGPLLNQYNPEILDAIKIHRKIDHYTDTHTIVRDSRYIFTKSRRRYAGIILDLAFDHFLSVNWSKYSNDSLDASIDNAYNILENNFNVLPQRLQSLLPKIIEEDWFGSYREVDGLALAIDRIAIRFSRKFENREIGLFGSIDEVKDNYKALEKNFKQFFPDIIKYVDSLIHSLIPAECASAC